MQENEALSVDFNYYRTVISLLPSVFSDVNVSSQLQSTQILMSIFIPIFSKNFMGNCDETNLVNQQKKCLVHADSYRLNMCGCHGVMFIKF